MKNVTVRYYIIEGVSAIIAYYQKLVFRNKQLN